MEDRASHDGGWAAQRSTVEAAKDVAALYGGGEPRLKRSLRENCEVTKMRHPDWNDAEFWDLSYRITSKEALSAFHLLINTSIELKEYLCRPGGHGFIDDYRFYNRASGLQPFSFIANESHLLFYVRGPGIRRVPGGKDALERVVGQVEEAGGEWKVRISTTEQAEALIRLLFPSHEVEV